MTKPPLLSVESVGRTFWRGIVEVPVLDGVSFEVNEGEFAAVAGRQASGKTTLVRIAAGLDAPDTGVVRFQGRDLHAEMRKSRFRGLPPSIGWMSRSGPQIPSQRMREYVAVPVLEDVSHRAASQRAMRALDSFGATQLADAVWSEMSDAQRTQAALARAIVREPALLVADDPTAGLDVHDREILLGLLRRVAETTGMATLIAVPEIADMLRSHKVMTLSDGELMQASRHKPGQVVEFPPRRRPGSA
ncbi:ATP-binding cassette domain-containing protein [Conexibacter sp. JD483]|uniref:ATP-binding cassette domain-containing protein n=1 Tax=unclassified Conexibacter TaxID=2627773 RepID=UPI00271BED85|nr:MULTISPECIES: ATP-binding cassette domain-containing protein [unclassified Conexibacter]MDO8185799.1 ATP-binding cassette domain-containing protein [Conexibacter sp. CPCC 205706]MDO8198543.1 ATP-binding cassette domain-containing protein [Conexibacter sp. CPCC 205762]MDR9367629.1 ATP-binding cassette domain-containing protein [Conexibacter sp. JD483]